MRVPLSWLGEFLTIEAGLDEVCARLAGAGLVVEKLERFSAGFAGVVVARVLKVDKHPNADRLSVCEVDAGGADQFQVVCGAPNVRAGMYAALAKVGARLKGSEPSFEPAPPVQAAVIRGVPSQGMLCSEHELGLSTDHTGILELDPGAPVGVDAAAYLSLDDVVLDVEVTPNRGDCLSILGIARELAALFGLPLKLPKLARNRHLRNGSAAAQLEILAPDLCPRYAALRMDGIEVRPSPFWVKRRLGLCAMRALNNVVDATNYVMLELGQPLHAFDWKKIAAGRIIVRRAGEAGELVTLDEAARRIEPDDLLIADPEKPLALAGVMGGLNSEVDDTTGTILLESAYFEPSAIARTARRLALASEASYRFARGVDRAGQVTALRRAAQILGPVAGGRQSGELVDLEPAPGAPRQIDLDLPAMASLLGMNLPASEVKRRLIAIGAKVKGDRRHLKVTAPSFRPDLNEPADLAEEVARLTGLAEVPATLPPRMTSVTRVDPHRTLLRDTREVMVGCGFTEVKTIAFAAPADNARFPGIGASSLGWSPLAVLNPLSVELSQLRLSLMPGLLAALRFNLNRQAGSFHAFEIGKVYAMGANGTAEAHRLAAVSYGQWATTGIGQNPLNASFWTMKGVLETFLEALGLFGRARYTPAPGDLMPSLHPGHSAEVRIDDGLIGYVGELHPSEGERLELGQPCALIELDFTGLLAYGLLPRKTIEPPPRYPAVRRDVALVVDREVAAGEVTRAFSELGSELLESVELFDVYEGERIGAGKKSVAIACRYRSKDRTLTDEEVNRAHSQLVEQVRVRLGAELRQ